MLFNQSASSIYSRVLQNPYTFGYLPSSLGGSLGIANISTRVPSLQFKYTNHTVVEVNNLQAESVVGMNASSRGPIKMVMAPSERIFIEQVDTKELAELWESGEYDPRVSWWSFLAQLVPLHRAVD